jgi:hypothetical protein
MLPCHRRGLWRVALAITAIAAGSVLLPVGGEAYQAGHDYDCTDFDTRQDAQAFYEAAGGPIYDPYNLDDDEDGIACEEWMRGYEQSVAGENGVNGRDGVDQDCADFASQAEARRYFDSDGGSAAANVDHLDPNRNGVACEPGEPG